MNLDPHILKDRSRGVGRDMSPDAVERRLDIVSELRDLALWLGKAERADSCSRDEPPKDHAADMAERRETV